jgi:hypothetical protein
LRNRGSEWLQQTGLILPMPYDGTGKIQLPGTQ